MLTLPEDLTTQFYDWERRGRGWQLWDTPVELEPPFRPFFHYFVPSTPDSEAGRSHTWLSSLIQSLRGAPSEAPPLLDEVPKIVEPGPAYAFQQDVLVEFQIALPADLSVTKTMSEHLLLNLNYCAGPVSFEVIGNGERIVVQLVCWEQDKFQLRQQIQAHFPEAMITEEEGFLLRQWNQPFRAEAVVVDFGLSQEFVRPLDTFRNFDVDPLIGVAGSLNELEDGEVGVFQVTFQPTRFPWAESIFRSVTDGEGGSFFCRCARNGGTGQRENRLSAVCVRGSRGRSKSTYRAGLGHRPQSGRGLDAVQQSGQQ